VEYLGCGGDGGNIRPFSVASRKGYLRFRESCYLISLNTSQLFPDLYSLTVRSRRVEKAVQ